MSENPVRSASEEAAKEVSKSFAELCDKETREKVYADIIESHLAPVVAAAEEAMAEKCAKVCLNNVLSEKQMNDEPNLHVGEMCLRLCHERDTAAIRAIPTGTAKEIAPCR